ncbi:hypothetical protein FH972_023935 [Carpinus fangiana]|uniref:Uncharacterized protein n=1 Tax=Carpinus fangiana TaxID=176857 RepID=A0A5N6KWZ3_9ROSI|nr:hypothetical protein FH972_023935 [Carpinus fangiana]
MTLFSARSERIIRYIRPLRPPNGLKQGPHSRLFAQKTPLLRASRPTNRPNLPYLTTPLRNATPTTRRLLSTEGANGLKYQIKLTLYWSAIAWTIFGGTTIAYYFLQQDWLDKQYPAPAEWPWYCKYRWREANWEEKTDGRGLNWIDWNRVGNAAKIVVMLLEDPKRLKRFFGQAESKNVLQDDFDKTIPGISEELMQSKIDWEMGEVWPGRTGYDITRQSEPWRRGYWEAMMTMARAAERMVGCMRYVKGPDANNKIYDPERIRSVKNPHPIPFPPGCEQFPLPNEEDCIEAQDPPDFLYLRILTTKGFSRKQRLDAGVAYAHWLDATERPQLAEQMYQWSLDLACDGVSNLADKIVNRKTGVINPSAPFVTDSILAVITALGSHHARHDNIPKAMNIYLSVLRARRAAPNAPPSRQYPAQAPDYSLNDPSSIIAYISSIPWTGNYPAHTPTGDDPFERTAHSACDEAAIMAYVGEILFSRSGQRAEGLSWTRDAAALAEAGRLDAKLDARGRKACTQCLETGLGNWQKMVAQLAAEKDARGQGGAKAASGWLWASKSAVEDDALVAQSDWREEERRLTDRVADLAEETLNDKLKAIIAQKRYWVVSESHVEHIEEPRISTARHCQQRLQPQAHLSTSLFRDQGDTFQQHQSRYRPEHAPRPTVHRVPHPVQAFGEPPPLVLIPHLQHQQEMVERYPGVSKGRSRHSRCFQRENRPNMRFDYVGYACKSYRAPRAP